METMGNVSGDAPCQRSEGREGKKDRLAGRRVALVSRLENDLT